MRVASIVHGAYGDYYQQLLCLRHYKETNPSIHLSIYFESASRHKEFQSVILDFADDIALWPDINKKKVDKIFQFQVKDVELIDNVIKNLPESILVKLDQENNILPYVYMRKHNLLGGNTKPFRLSQEGEKKYREVVELSGANDEFFSNTVIGFQWRHRLPGKDAAIKNFGQQKPDVLVDTYSAAFKNLANDYGFKFLIAGMKVITNNTNRSIVDGKYPEYGLNLSEDIAVHLPGKSWLIEMELMRRVNAFASHPSGFSEGLFLTGGGGVLLDPPYHYLIKLLRYRVNMFNFFSPNLFCRYLKQPYSSSDIEKIILKAMHGVKT